MDLLVREVEDLVEHLPLTLLDLARLARGADEHLQLRLGVGLGLHTGQPQVEEMEHPRGRSLQDPDERRKEDEEPSHRRRHGERRPLRIAECDPLRHQLADHDVQERDHDERDRDGEERGDDRVQDLGEHRLAESTDTERGERDAELHGRDEARRPRDDLQHVRARAIALLLKLDDLRPARRHEAVLRSHEKRVQEQQPGDGGQLEEDRHAPVSPEA